MGNKVINVFNELNNIRAIAMEIKKKHSDFPMDLSKVETTTDKKEVVRIFKEATNIFKEQFEEDFFDQNIIEKYVALIDGTEDPELLEYIVRNTSANIGDRALTNKHMPENVLREYAEIETEDEIDKVWYLVGILDNPNTPTDIIKKVIDEYAEAIKADSVSDDWDYFTDAINEKTDSMSLAVLAYYLYKTP